MAGAVGRALIFLAGGVAAAAATAYYAGALDPYLSGKPQEVAALPNASTPQPDLKESRLPAQEQPKQPAAALPDAGKAAPAEENKAPPAEAATPPSAPAATGEAGEEAATAGKTPDVAAAVQAPSFDIVRAEADGSLVIAGKAAPNAKVEIVLGAKVIGNAVAGPEGDFAVAIDEPLKPGAHQIVLRSTNPDSVVSTSPETAVVSIPETRSGQVLALVEQPGAPSKLISVPQPEKVAKPSAETPAASGGAVAQPEAPAAETAEKPQQQAAVAPETTPGKADAPAVAAGPAVKVEAVEIEGRKVFIAGTADPGRKVRGYANDILLGEVVTSPGGRFLIETERDLPAGDYIIRVDALSPDGAKVVARAAVPFEREAGEAQSAVAPQATPAAGTEKEPEQVSGAQPQGVEPQSGSHEIAATTPDELSPKLQNVEGAVIIRRGDSLWRISRRVYGLGVRYSTIYLANQEQIRDPNLIWPGQVFKVPEKTSQGEAANLKAVGEQATTLPPQ
ncbi:nucleoid-associated protein YgaU [Pseudaminobacter salicylatoxidans]|uniref:Nucleoid-associated protein YgaU n=1 Tax=Pseudaminobacter salicylatoxidans TaxID=93369 RepID=A0A316C641_PSESE|nr:LysM peptidoglycan-binding domain-containing protein [Pseudaminobacter salicylatoxidans]PWJ85242.1 nucleoid-associated protein YgaU [Pseudaminobacter salicylatoxidans]